MDEYYRQSNSRIAALQNQIDAISSKLQQIDPHNNLIELIQANSHIELTQHLHEFSNARLI